MTDQLDKQLLQKLTNHLHNSQHIPTAILQRMPHYAIGDTACYAGLMNLLYNMGRQLRSRGRERIMVEGEAKGEQQRDQEQDQYLRHDWAGVLFLRGEILKEYVKFLTIVLFSPAYQLAAFRYQQFNDFCSQRGQKDLIRQTRGIYPIIDPKKTKPLQFLPFYEQLKTSNVLMGNQNWKLAKLIVQKFYQQKIKTNKFLSNQSQAEKSNVLDGLEGLGEDRKFSKTDQENFIKGIQLCYQLLTQKYEELREYINQVEQINIKNEAIDMSQMIQPQRQSIKRFTFWLQNYQKFHQQGMQLYTNPSTTSHPPPPLLHNPPATPTIESQLLTLISQFHQLSQLSRTADQLPAAQLQLIGQRLCQLAASIESDSTHTVVRRRETYYNANRQFEEYLVYKTFSHVDKMLFYAFIWKIGEVVDPEGWAEVGKVVKDIYVRSLDYLDPYEQPFNRIFFTDTQILALYQQGKIKQYPTTYIYSNQLMSKILKQIIKKSPQNLIKNYNKFSLLKPHERMGLIITNKYLGDVGELYKSSVGVGGGKGKGELTRGERLLELFEQICVDGEYKGLVVGEGASKKIQAEKVYQNFIKQWKQYFEIIRNFTRKSFQQCLINYQKYRVHISTPPKTSTQHLKPSDFIPPIQRQDCRYYLIAKFLTMMQHHKNRLLKVCQKLQPQKRKQYEQFQALSEELSKFISIAKKQSFRHLLQNANRFRSVVVGGEQNLKLSDRQLDQKQVFQDRLWRVYSESVLLVGQECRKLVSDGQPEFHPKSPEKRHKAF